MIRVDSGLVVKHYNNKKKRGYNIGQRMIEDFLARSAIGRCSEFRDTAEAISKVFFIVP
jgi:hypothetical protein